MPEVPIQEAATRLGVHPATIRRRIASGHLPARLDPQGRYLVSLSGAQALLGGGGTSEVEALRDELEELRQDLARVTQERDQYRERFERTYGNYEKLYEDARADRERASVTHLEQLAVIREMQTQLLSMVQARNGPAPAPPATAHITADADGRILTFDSGAEAMFGWTAPEVVGARLAETIIPPRYREAHEAGLARYARTRNSVLFGKPLPLSGLRKAGGEFPLQLTLVTMSQDPLVFQAAITATP